MDDFVKRSPELAPKVTSGLMRRLKDQKFLFGMSLPFVAWLFVFAYVPIWGWVMAFQKYKIGKAFFDQQWVGFYWFGELFKDPEFYKSLYNTLGMSVLGLLAGFTVPIIFALLLNELRGGTFKRSVQTISYLPHFVSWVVVANIVYKLLSTDGGMLNDLFVAIGLQGPNDPSVVSKGSWFWGIVTVADLWKEMGWNSIIFISAMTAIDPELYEAAKVDGAGRFKQMWHITLPGIRHLIVVLLVLSIGSIISIGFEKQFLLGNPRVIDSYMVIDLYALQSIRSFRFSLGTAIGVFKSVVSVILLFTANGIFKKMTGESVM